jgi:hypothetical protein
MAVRLSLSTTTAAALVAFGPLNVCLAHELQERRLSYSPLIFANAECPQPIDFDLRSLLTCQRIQQFSELSKKVVASQLERWSQLSKQMLDPARI